MYNSAVNLWAWSKFNSIVNFDPLMANDGALKSWDQSKFVLGLLAGDRNNYKTKLLAQGKQTVCMLERGTEISMLSRAQKMLIGI